MYYMSIRALGWAMHRECPTPTTKLVLICLANYADEADSCYPSEKHLGKLCGISDRQVRRSIRTLADLGMVTVQSRTGTSNRYVLTVDAHVHRGADSSVRGGRTPASANTKEIQNNNRSMNELAG